MKVLLFHANKDEIEYLWECNQKFKFDLVLAEFDFQMAGFKELKGYDAIWITTNCKIDRQKAELLHSAGIRYIVSRAAGIDHMDLNALMEFQIKAANVPRYSPWAIAEHTICMLLMVLRNMKRELKMVEQYDFSLNGLKGRELRNLTVGVVGTGRIGVETIKCLSGFGCRILAYDIYQNKEIKHLVTYVEQTELFTTSDVIVLHCPLTRENERLIQAESIALMKEGVVLINTARGGLMDYKDILEAVEKGKISAIAFDVYDDEASYIRKKIDSNNFKDNTLRKLIEHENVIYTAHMSFYTDTAIENMIMTSFENLAEYRTKKSCSNEINMGQE